jgi:serine/threonine-protein kinase
VESNQQLAVEVIQGDVTLNIRNPNGQLIEDASNINFWQAQLPQGGNYIIDVIAQRPTTFTLGVSLTNRS